MNYYYSFKSSELVVAVGLKPNAKSLMLAQIKIYFSSKSSMNSSMVIAELESEIQDIVFMLKGKLIVCLSKNPK